MLSYFQNNRSNSILIAFQFLLFLCAFIGWCVHLALCYQTEGLPTRTNEFVGVFACLYLMLTSGISIWFLIPPKQIITTDKTTKTLFVFLCVCSVIGGFCTSISYWACEEYSGGSWSFLWFVSGTITVSALSFRQFNSSNENSTSKSNSKRESELEHQSPIFPKEPSRAKRVLFGIWACLRWTFFVIATIFMILFVMQSIGVSYEYNYYTPMGVLVPLVPTTGKGSYRIHVYCNGTKSNPASPTYWLEGGGGTSGLSLIAIQESLVANGKRVCAVDRPGYGFSDSGEVPRTLDIYHREAQAEMEYVGESGPFVLIGHSQGANIIQWFAKYFPEKVAALVALDGYPNYLRIIGPVYGYTNETIESITKNTVSILDVARAFSVFGIIRFIITTNSDFTPQSYAHQQASGYWNNKNWNVQYQEILATTLEDQDAAIANLNVGSKPVLIISAQTTANSTTCADVNEDEGSLACTQALEASQLYGKAAKAMAERLSTNGTWIVAPTGSDHGFPWEANYYPWVVNQILSLGL